MTIQRAREILGDEIENLSDSEVQAMIDRDFIFCDALLDVIMASNERVLSQHMVSTPGS